MKKVHAVYSVAAADVACAQPAPVFPSLRAERDVALETDPGSAFWQSAPPVYLNFDNLGNPFPGRSAEVRSRWTQENLYVLFVCPYRTLNLKPNPHPETETDRLWNWDVAEIFLGSDFHDIRRYKEFEISPQGEWIDLDVNLDAPHHEDGWTWNSGFQVSARINRRQKIWYGAMKIPMASIDPQPVRAGTSFRANMFRTEGAAPGTRLNAWSPTMSPSFHVPSHFGRLELVDCE